MVRSSGLKGSTSCIVSFLHIPDSSIHHCVISFVRAEMMLVTWDLLNVLFISRLFTMTESFSHKICISSALIIVTDHVGYFLRMGPFYSVLWIELRVSDTVGLHSSQDKDLLLLTRGCRPALRSWVLGGERGGCKEISAAACVTRRRRVC